MTRSVVKPMNTTFAGVMAGVSIVLAGCLVCCPWWRYCLGQVELSWDGAWFVLRIILLINLYMVGFRYFRARAR